MRTASPADLDAIEAVEKAAFAPLDRFPRRNLSRLLRRGHARFLVARTGGATVGYAVVLFRAGAAAARLYSLAVAPAARGCGAGAKLLAAAERAARAKGCDRLRLEAREENRPARSLYETRGYERVTDLEDYYPDGGDGVRFEKRLRRAARKFTA